MVNCMICCIKWWMLKNGKTKSTLMLKEHLWYHLVILTFDRYSSVVSKIQMKGKWSGPTQGCYNDAQNLIWVLEENLAVFKHQGEGTIIGFTKSPYLFLALYLNSLFIEFSLRAKAPQMLLLYNLGARLYFKMCVTGVYITYNGYESSIWKKWKSDNIEIRLTNHMHLFMLWISPILWKH